MDKDKLVVGKIEQLSNAEYYKHFKDRAKFPHQKGAALQSNLLLAAKIINPDNPQAVADGLVELFQIANIIAIQKQEHMNKSWMYDLTDVRFAPLKEILSKIQAKEPNEKK